jgi:hypothetical protein
MRLARLGRRQPEWVREKMRKKRQKCKHLTEEHRQKISMATRGVKKKKSNPVENEFIEITTDCFNFRNWTPVYEET